MPQPKNNAYWQRRFELLKVKELALTEDYKKEMTDLYEQSLARIDKEVAYWYKRFMKNEGVNNLVDAKQKLTKQELREFRWSVDEYIKAGRENAVRNEWIKELENASARWHIERLQALEFSLRHEIELLHAEEQRIVEESSKEIYKNTYYQSAFEIAKGTGVGVYLPALDDKSLDIVTCKPWRASGKDFSASIWNDRASLIDNIHYELAQMAIHGDGPDKAIKRIADRFNVGKSNAGRLIQSENAAFSSRARQTTFSDLGVERFIYLATLDSHTSELCRYRDGTITLMSAYEVGITAPPLHPWCRSTTAPFFEDMKTTRAVRGKDGKTYYVRGDMSYQEWYGEYVEGTEKIDKKAEKWYNNNKQTKLSGAISGALNPGSDEALDHAVRYYESVRAMNTDYKVIAVNTGFSEAEVKNIKDYLFIEEHDFLIERNGDGHFFPDYMISQSWQRLIEGKNIQKHDMLLLEHERLERELVKRGVSQKDAHLTAEASYNYAKEAIRYHVEFNKHQKRK